MKKYYAQSYANKLKFSWNKQIPRNNRLTKLFIKIRKNRRVRYFRFKFRTSWLYYQKLKKK